MPTLHKPLAVRFANVTTTSSIASGTLIAGPVVVSVSILKKKDLTHQLLGLAPFTQAGCEAHLTNTTAIITKDGQPILAATKAPSAELWTVDLNQLN